MNAFVLAPDFPETRQFARGTERNTRQYAELNKPADVGIIMRRAYEGRQSLRKRGGPLSQRSSLFSKPTLEQNYSPRVARPLLRDLTAARRQTMARQGVRVPPPSPATAPGAKKGAVAVRGGRGGAAMSRAKQMFARPGAAQPAFATYAPGQCVSCKKLELG